jgi:glycosyltransferase involved in cell wall biosynthesis
LTGHDANQFPEDTVSVVIPAHNYAHYLPQTLRSVLAQTHPRFEIIVVDDGSTDDTRAVVAAEHDPRVRYVWQENAGLSAARNAGIRASRHAMIAFLDADDLWEPELLATIVAQFGRLSPDFGLVATNMSRIDAEGTPMPPPKRVWDSDREFTVRDFCIRNRPLSSSVVVRREVFAAIGDFDTTLRSSEDRDLWIRATAQGFRFWFIHQRLCRIRRHRGNMSAHASRMRDNSRAVLVRAWQRGVVPRWDLRFWGKVFAVHYQQVATTHFEAGRKLRALGYLTESWLHWPFFANSREVHEPVLFRLRTLVHFFRRW